MLLPGYLLLLKMEDAMKQLLYLLLTFFFCISITTFSQNPEWINAENEPVNAHVTDFKVNENDSGNTSCHYPSVVVDENGNFVIIWLSDNNIYAQRFSSDGIALDSNFQVKNDNAFESLLWPSIAADSSGNFVISWFSDHDIYAQRYSSDGNAIGPNFKVNDYDGNVGPRSPSISTDGSGNFVIIWQAWRNSDYNIYAQRFSSDGIALDSNFMVSNYGGYLNSSISMDSNGNFVITWWAYHDIYAQRYSSDGTVLIDKFKVSDVAGTIGGPHGGLPSPSISTDDNGHFVITWQCGRNGNDFDIYAQRFSSDGIALDSNFKVNDDEGESDQSIPSISSDDSGNFVITWTDRRNGDLDIYAQRYSSDGSALGINFLVPNIREGEQSSPDVKLWNGRIYNTWTDKTGYDIWANVLDWDNPVGVREEENSLPSEYTLHQNYPNPFNPSTKINYSIPSSVIASEAKQSQEITSVTSFPRNDNSHVTLKVYDILGRVVATLVNEQQKAGTYNVQFTTNNEQLSSGVYFYQLRVYAPGRAGDFVETKKMILLR